MYEPTVDHFFTLSKSEPEAPSEIHAVDPEPSPKIRTILEQLPRSHDDIVTWEICRIHRYIPGTYMRWSRLVESQERPRTALVYATAQVNLEMFSRKRRSNRSTCRNLEMRHYNSSGSTSSVVLFAEFEAFSPVC